MLNSEKLRLDIKKNEQKQYLWLTLLLSFIGACLVFLPYLVTNGGFLTIVDDFNTQQISFNMYANQAIKNGEIWSRELDIGTGLVPGFSFYNLGSPFFWLSMLFPADFFPYLVGPLYILKYMAAAVFSYLYIARFTDQRKHAILGAMLYAFSGFQAANTIFNHFHDVTAFFPLLLIALEELALHKKRGVFALAVGFACLLNYVFFAAEVVFVILYFVVRFLIPQWKTQWKRLWEYVLEGLLGVGLGAVLFLPSMLATLSLPRAQAKIPFRNWFLFSPDRYINLLRSFLFPGDFMAGEVIDPPTYYSSASLWLPAVGILLVVLFLAKAKPKEDHWLRNLLIVCFIFMYIPVLNSVFTGFSSIPYFRWFFMPILLIALASAKTLDYLEHRAKKNHTQISYAFIATLVFLLAFILLCFYYPPARPDRVEIGIITNVKYFSFLAVLAILGLFLSYILLSKLDSKRVFSVLVAVVILFGATNQSYTIWRGHHSRRVNYPENVVRLGYGQAKQFADLAEEAELDLDLYRYQIADDHQNLALFNNLPSINSFSSTVSSSIYRFYSEIGQSRFVASVNLTPGLQSLLGAKWFVSPTKRTDKGELLISEESEDGTSAYVYELPTFLPVGFSYEYFIDWADFQAVPFPERSYLVHRALPLKPEQLALAESLNLTELPQDRRTNLTEEQMSTDDRNLVGITDIEWLRDGFIAEYELSEDGNLFFSVPWESGWTATINGEIVPIYESMGLIFVPVPAGSNQIQFSYQTPGLKTGIAVSAVSAVFLAAYYLIDKKRAASRDHSYSK